jgi:hypothetical protein
MRAKIAKKVRTYLSTKEDLMADKYAYSDARSFMHKKLLKDEKYIRKCEVLCARWRMRS